MYAGPAQAPPPRPPLRALSLRSLRAQPQPQQQVSQRITLLRIGSLSNLEKCLIYREISRQVRLFTMPITGHFIRGIEIHALRLSHFVSRHVYGRSLFVDGTSKDIDSTIGIPFRRDFQLITVLVIIARGF